MAELRRNLSLPLLLFYGLGTILGAGIYVLTGVVAGHAGTYAPLAFFLAALVAAPTALSYARLSSRYPASAGEAVYVREAFNNDGLAKVIGALVVTVGIVSAATIARGFVGYLHVFVEAPDWLVIVLLVIVLTTLAIYGVLESVAAAALVAVVEIAGLVLVISGGLLQPEKLPMDIFPPLDAGSAMIWSGVFAGAFLAFYAFIGFEDIVNMGEETRDPERNLPLAVIGSLAIASILYFLVTWVAVITVPLEALANHPAPMALVVEQHGLFSARFISLISMLAVVNGALVQIIMASRVIYGVARMQSESNLLAYVNPYTQTPMVATLIAAAIVLLLALAFDVESLATVTSLVTLGIFFMINLALIRIQGGLQRAGDLIAWLGAGLCLVLISASAVLL